MTRAAIIIAILAPLAFATANEGTRLATAEAAMAQGQQSGRWASDNKERQSKMTMDWATGKCEGIARIEGLDGKPDAQIAKMLGEPERKETFRLGEREDEFHISLQNHYPLAKSANRDVQVQEWTWTKGECRLTVWLHKKNDNWVGLENIRYSTDAEF